MSDLQNELSQAVPHQNSGVVNAATAVLDEVVEVTMSRWVAWLMLGLAVLLVGVGLMMGLSKDLKPSDAKVAPIVVWVAPGLAAFLIFAAIVYLRSCNEVVISLRPEGLTIKKEALIEWSDVAMAHEVSLSLRNGQTTYLAITLSIPGRRKRHAAGGKKGAMTKLIRKAAKILGSGCDMLVSGQMLTETPADLAIMINERIAATQHIQP
jgi:hypothetical protein